MLKIIDNKILSAQKNMEKDLDLLINCDLEKKPILHFHIWEKPSLTYGYFADIEKLIDKNVAEKEGLDLGKRPTGGGVLFHIWDLSFGFVLPKEDKRFSKNVLTNYGFVNKIVVDAINSFLNQKGIIDFKIEFLKEEKKRNKLNNFCMALPTMYDVLINGKKVVGAAQRQKNQGFLHQGTISLIKPDEKLLKKVLKDERILDAFYDSSFYLFDDFNIEDIKKEKELLKKALIGSFEKSLL